MDPDDQADVVPGQPWLPPGRHVELPGRGTTFIRELAGPPGAPVLLLLHGWTATADLNWFTCFPELGRRFRVVAMDDRGHGRGIRSRRAFRLEDCADDAAALLDVLEIDSTVPVGYSMGGPVAQLLWQRHRDRVDGMVLCATAMGFRTTREERLGFTALSGLAVAAKVAPPFARTWASTQFIGRKAYHEWAERQVRRHDWTAVLEAGRAIGGFSSSEWTGEVDVPVAVILTMRDHVVPPRRQIRLAQAIPGALAFRVDGGHDAVVAVTERFVPTLVSAATLVTERARTGTGAG